MKMTKKFIREKFFNFETGFLFLASVLAYLLSLIGYLALRKIGVEQVLIENVWSFKGTLFLGFNVLLMLLVILFSAVKKSKEEFVIFFRRLVLILLLSLFIPEIIKLFNFEGYFSFLGNIFRGWWIVNLWVFVFGWARIIDFYFDLEKFKPKNVKWWLWGFAVFYVGFFVAHGIYLHKEFGTVGCDFGIYDQSLWQMAYNGSFLNTVNEFNHTFGAHMSPILVVLAPFYWLWNDAKMLLVLEVLIVALGAWPAFRIAKRNTGNDFFAMSVVVMYLLFVGNRGALSFPFHPQTLIAPLALAAFDFFEQKKWLWHGVFMILLMSAKENASNLVVMFGVIILLTRREYWKLGWIYILSGVTWLGVATKYLVPGFNGDNYGFFYYQALGENQIEGMRTLLQNPLYVFRVMFDNPIKVETLLSVLASGGFLMFLSPYVLFLMPGLIEQLTSSRSAMWVNFVYYSSSLAFGLVVAVIFGVKRLAERVERKRLYAFCGLMLLGLSLGLAISYQFITAAREGKLIRYEFKEEFAGAKEIIGDKSDVATQSNLVPQISHRNKIYRYPTVKDAKYILLDVNLEPWPLSEGGYKNRLEGLLKSGDWGLVYSKAGVVLFERGVNDKVEVSGMVREFLEK